MKHPISEFKNIHDLINSLNQQISQGNIKATPLDGTNLVIYNYTPKVMLDNIWNLTNTIARGLVIDIEAKEIVAISFPKFFNLNEKGTIIAKEEFENCEVFEKYDGSLIIVFWHKDQWYFSTRGKINSIQAVEAQKWFSKNSDFSLLDKNVSYLFECVFASDVMIPGTSKRISDNIVKYDETKMYLLAAYNKNTLEEIQLEELPDVAEHAAKHSFDNFDDLIKYLKTTNKMTEGVVVKTKLKRIKIKSDLYHMVHRAKENFTKKNVWEAIYENKLLAYKINLPEEFWDELDQYVKEITEEYDRLDNQINDIIKILRTMSDEEKVLWFKENKKNPLNQLVYMKLNKPENYHTALMGRIK